MKYYGQLKRYLNIPNVFRGVAESGDDSIFPVMIERYQQAPVISITEKKKFIIIEIHEECLC